MYNKTTFVKKVENNKFEESLSDHDLYSLTLFFLNNYKNDAAIWVDAIYYFITLLNGDRSYECAGDTKMEHIKVNTIFIGYN